jgi:hypothetical protein
MSSGVRVRLPADAGVSGIRQAPWVMVGESVRDEPTRNGQGPAMLFLGEQLAEIL